ncbi:hypothetical protein [Candidatus Magnetaquicoccus inordinatus]|uniref:hypothetical protein n=1 Tax=Candidatus Magnetaquicoccus inordinatus TaxID=2496818 RepID=UPI00102BC6E5|nr:hypothetical protein [Candidatus Magnetaquicoccus inordinatus]
MRVMLVMLGLLVMVPWGDLHAKEIYKSGRYTVRKVEGTCKLEILLHEGDQEPAAILALFPSDEFFGEMFTEKARIGVAQKKVRIQFDQDKPKDINFVADASAKDNYWRWQYLENTQGILGLLGKRTKMIVSFSNGKTMFKYTVPLKGSTKAVMALRHCR